MEDITTAECVEDADEESADLHQSYLSQKRLGSRFETLSDCIWGMRFIHRYDLKRGIRTGRKRGGREIRHEVAIEERGAIGEDARGRVAGVGECLHLNDEHGVEERPHNYLLGWRELQRSG